MMLLYMLLQRWRVNKKQGVNFMLGSWQGLNGRKKFESPCSSCIA